MLAFEEAFDLDFPEDLLHRSNFESLSAMGRAISGLVEQRRTA
jgi:acyl carrier protein